MDLSLVTYHKPKAPESEAYRMLRTNLGYTGVDKKHQVILVTSSRMQEGKSTTASNLAITMAQSDHKVLLIDADMRRPRLHKLFKLDNLLGLTDIVVKDESFDKVVFHCSEVKNLDVITSGEIPPMPSEILDSKK
jgi:capsular exopolysaccharide synthesis family protein